MRKTLRRFHYWIRNRQSSHDLAEELEFHRALKQQELERSGLPNDAAESASRRAMGNTLTAMEDARRVWISLWLEQAIQDLRYAARSLARTPGFVLAAGLTIALGVGANTAVFRLIDAVLLQLLPVHAPKELVFVEPAGKPEGPRSAPPYPCLFQLPAPNGALVGLTAFATDELR